MYLALGRLSNYPYRVNIGWVVGLISLLLVFLCGQTNLAGDSYRDSNRIYNIQGSYSTATKTHIIRTLIR
jgi:hypothetical protein